MVSDVVLVAMIAAIPATLAAAVGFVNRSKLHEVSERVDGRLDQLLEMAEKGAFARGVKQESDKLNGSQSAS